MKPLTCETVRDLVPDLPGRRLDHFEDAAVRAHLRGCADCQVEYELVSAIAAARLTVPAGLSERVVQGALNRRAGSWTGVTALAASITVAVLGGSLLLQQMLPRTETLRPPVVEVSEVGAGWLGVEDAFVSGAASLRDLSEAELEKLLSELGS
jgi:hypothetical protein